MQSEQARSRLAAAGLLAVSLAALLGRIPMLIEHPRFWAEEGTSFFALAFDSGFLANLAHLHHGYYLFYLSLATSLATLAPLELAPAVTTAAAALAHLLPVALILSGRSSLWPSLPRKALAVACVLLALPFAENWLTTTNSQFVLSISAFVLLLEDEPHGKAARTLRTLLLIVCVLTGVPSCLLAPAFLVRAFQRRTGYWVALATVATVGCLAQGTSVLMLHFSAPATLQRRTELSPELVAAAVGLKAEVAPFLGIAAEARSAEALQQAGPGLLAGEAAASLILWGALVALAARGLARSQRAPFVIGLASMLFISLLGSLDDKRVLLAPEASTRYFSAPNTALLLALAAGSSVKGALSRLRALLVVSALGAGAVYFRLSPWTQPGQPQWPDEVAHWRRDPSYQPAISPEGWRVKLGHSATSR